ncbi:MAG: flagellar hook-basal body complex protein FliE [Pseudomonadales bacterium]|nr:flagellar hook-basal body complex protein FliE [Pseudomonadales bacterium]
MSSPSIQSVLQQMQTLNSQVGGSTERGRQVDTTVGRSGFAEEMHNSIERINQLQHKAASQIKAFEAGQPDVALNDVMVDMQKAGLAFQMGVQVRNRLVNAYKEIMNMQV